MNSIAGLLQLDILAKRSTEKIYFMDVWRCYKYVSLVPKSIFFSFCLPFTKKWLLECIKYEARNCRSLQLRLVIRPNYSSRLWLGWVSNFLLRLFLFMLHCLFDPRAEEGRHLSFARKTKKKKKTPKKTPKTRQNHPSQWLRGHVCLQDTMCCHFPADIFLTKKLDNLACGGCVCRHSADPNSRGQSMTRTCIVRRSHGNSCSRYLVRAGKTRVSGTTRFCQVERLTTITTFLLVFVSHDDFIEEE